MLRKRLHEQVDQLREQVGEQLALVASLARREDQSALSWNLLLNEREDTITSLQEQLRLVQKFDFDNKEFDLDNKELNLDNKEELIRHDMNSLAMEEQAGLKAELDALAKEETSLNNLLFSITDALSTVQGCPPCSPAAAQLEEAVAQLAILTVLLGGDTEGLSSSRSHEDRLSYRSSLEKEELLPTPGSSSATSSSRSSLERDGEEEGRSLSPASLCSQDREWSYSVSYIASSHQENEEDAESCYFSYPGPSPGPSSPLPSPILGLRRQGSTSILLERSSDTGDITSIVRLDSQQPPAILYSKQLDSETVIDENAEYVEESEVTYHNYTAVEKREKGSQTESEKVTLKMEGSTQTSLVKDVKEGSAQTEEQVEVAEVRRRRESRELALSLAQQELADVVGKLEAAQERGAEQVAEIELLGRRVDQLQRRRGSLKTEAEASNRPTTFIIKDMQSQVQELEEKNVKKDSLIKKLAETVVKSQGISVHAVIDSLRTATVKPSDRRIDFDIDTLLSFLERRKLSSSSSSSSLSSFSSSFSSSSLPRISNNNIFVNARGRQ